MHVEITSMVISLEHCLMNKLRGLYIPIYTLLNVRDSDLGKRLMLLMRKI